MSEKMTPLPFETLLRWACAEYESKGTIFGVERRYVKKSDNRLNLFGEKLDTPFGPAAGPNTQLAQNIVSAWFSGGRFFELKTVQELDGDQLAACIKRPCILANDEGYNCEWSTELTSVQAAEEYIKAWVLLRFLINHFKLGNPDGFIFNISVGYNLADIKKEKTDTFINSMKNAALTKAYTESIDCLLENFPSERNYIRSIPASICRSVTVSTLHGCPPAEIEAIASYLLSEKHLHTFVKCNPTLLGYETARERLNTLGYDYIQFSDFHFNDDLQWNDAVSMFRRLQNLANSLSLEFGLKLTNTFPVDVTANELPSSEMYMSGRSLYPLTVELANRISREFSGRMRISYSGGADLFNVVDLFNAGIWPITMATTILKPGGYSRFAQIAEKLESSEFSEFTKTDTEKLSRLSSDVLSDLRYRKSIKPLPSRKINEQVPLIDCFRAPCKDGCTIGQDIPEYMELCRKGLYYEALKIITEKNPLPFITGTICAHRCMNKCTRNFYEEAVDIRNVKLIAAENGYGRLLRSILRPEGVIGKKAAIIGAGPTGIAAAYFLARAGIRVDVFEKNKRPGGIVREVIPAFRISDEAIDKDVSLAEAYGANFICGAPAPSVAELKLRGYTHVLFAIGAWKAGKLNIEGNVEGVISWLRKMKTGYTEVPDNVAVIGGGNTAMDAARLAKKAGARSVIVYRRTKRFMPADEQELLSALREGVEFMELAAPVKQENGVLTLEKMTLGAPDEKGRRSPVPTGDYIDLPCDLVISAVGEKVETDLLTANGIELNEKGLPSFATNLEGVYVAGDSLRGPATVVEGIADARDFAEAVIGKKYTYQIPSEAVTQKRDCFSRKGILKMHESDDSSRCLSCSVICQNCVDVCPNRANVSIRTDDGKRQILHVDSICNECGNCTTFCPYSSEPCKDKFTLFRTEEEFRSSHNAGFLPLGGEKALVRLGLSEKEYDLSSKEHGLYEPIAKLIKTVLQKYDYLL